MAKEKPCCAVRSYDPLAGLLDLASRAEQIESEVYALPCSRQSDQPCRGISVTSPGMSQPRRDDETAIHWCDTCRAWFHSHRLTSYLMGLCRMVRDLQRASAASIDVPGPQEPEPE